MSELVVDASVAIKWFIPEVESESAVQLLHAGVAFAAPDLIGPELANTLWKKVRRAEITGDEAMAILAAFARLEIEIYPSTVLLPSALELAMNLDRTVYDSLYVALAIARDCDVVTADQKFVAALSGSPFAGRVRLLAPQN
jgi:predicted nucleic acid-binding protein